MKKMKEYIVRGIPYARECEWAVIGTRCVPVNGKVTFDNADLLQELVCCKDCEHSYISNCNPLNIDTLYCKRGYEVNEEDFCSQGKRRQEAPKLKRCPFCKGVPEKVEYEPKVNCYYVKCPDCYASTRACLTAEEAADCWNRRDKDG